MNIDLSKVYTIIVLVGLHDISSTGKSKHNYMYDFQHKLMVPFRAYSSNCWARFCYLPSTKFSDFQSLDLASINFSEFLTTPNMPNNDPEIYFLPCTNFSNYYISH